MILYITLHIMTLLGIILKKLKVQIFFLNCLTIIIFSAIRFEVGTDYKNYAKAFLQNKYIWFDEIGMIYIIKLLKTISEEPKIFFIVTSVLINICFMSWIYKRNKTINFELFLYVNLYYLATSFNLIRQFLAIGIILLFIDKKNKKYMAIFMATLFHKASLITYPLIMLSNITMSRKLVKKIHIISIFLMFVNIKYILVYFIKSILKFFNYGRYTYYLTYGLNKYLDYKLSYKLIVFIFIKFLIDYIVIDQIRVPKKYKIYLNLYIFSVILTNILYPYLILRRSLYYVDIFSIVIYSYLCYKNKKMCIYIYIYILICYFGSLLLNYSSVVPYRIY